MTLKILPDLEQGSDEWLQQRCGMVTASTVGKLITTKTLKPADNDTSRGLTETLVAERITGHVEPTFISADMWRGTEHEPLARDRYAECYAPVEEVGFMVRTLPSGHQLGYSPDGLVGDVGLLEIKCPRPKNHIRTILADRVPTVYMAQLQCGLLVSGRDWIDFVSFSGGLPLWTKRVYRDDRWHLAIVEAVEQFETNAADMQSRYSQATNGLPTTERVVEMEMTL